jgi:hypothetical protein
MLGLIGTFFTSIISGGLTGIFGVGVQRYADYKNKELDLAASRDKMAHEVTLRKVDAEIMAQEWAARTKVAEVEAAGKEAVADSQAFAASFHMEPVRYSGDVKPTPGQGWLLVILDFVRGMIRPSLTVYLCVLTTLVYFQARDIQVRAGVSSEEAYQVVQQVVGTVLYLTTTCVLWYFGTRNKGQPPKVSK